MTNLIIKACLSLIVKEPIIMTDSKHISNFSTDFHNSPYVGRNWIVGHENKLSGFPKASYSETLKINVCKHAVLCQAGNLLWNEDGMSVVFICGMFSADHGHETSEPIRKGGRAVLTNGTSDDFWTTRRI